jgi:hypothetical protein
MLLTILTGATERIGKYLRQGISYLIAFLSPTDLIHPGSKIEIIVLARLRRVDNAITKDAVITFFKISIIYLRL